MINTKEMNCYEWKGNIINYLIKKNDYKSYLELGIGNGDTWNIVECEKKVGVDFNISSKIDNRIVTKTTDDFFSQNKDKFDLIYIDAKHEKNQVFLDFKNSSEFITKGGMILFHDINPISKSDTGFNSSGDVFKFWVFICKNMKSSTLIGPQEDALGIIESIDISDKIKIENLNFDCEFEYFDENRNEFIYKKIYNSI